MNTEIPSEWAGLPVSLDSERSMFNNTTAFRVLVRGDVHKWGALTTVTNELLADSGIDVTGMIRHDLDRFVRPWLYPSVPAFPFIVLFPRWDRFIATIRRAKQRLRYWLPRREVVDDEPWDW